MRHVVLSSRTWFRAAVIANLQTSVLEICRKDLGPQWIRGELPTGSREAGRLKEQVGIEKEKVVVKVVEEVVNRLALLPLLG